MSDSVFKDCKTYINKIKQLLSVLFMKSDLTPMALTLGIFCIILQNKWDISVLFPNQVKLNYKV